MHPFGPLTAKTAAASSLSFVTSNKAIRSRDLKFLEDASWISGRSSTCWPIMLRSVEADLINKSILDGTVSIDRGFAIEAIYLGREDRMAGKLWAVVSSHAGSLKRSEI